MGPKTEILRAAYEAARQGSDERPVHTAAVGLGMSPDNPNPMRWAYGKLVRSGYRPQP